MFLYLTYNFIVCCYLLVGKGANKVQECLLSEEYYAEEELKS
jgi:hypothetical protein